MAISAKPDDPLAGDDEDLSGYMSDTPLHPKPSYPAFKSNFDTAVIVTNLPKVNKSRVEKLTKYFTKLVSHIAPLATSSEFGGVYVPFSDELQTTLGFGFVEYTSPEDAKKAVEALENYKFDKNHNVKAFFYERAAMLEDLEEGEFKEPPPAPFVKRLNTSSWLEDKSQRDEFVIRQGKETIVYWNDGKNDPTVDYDGSREKDAGVSWCEFYVHWSPKGSYLATLVPGKGVILWGGDKFEKIGRFPHPGVQFVVFSPQEGYLLTNNNRRDDDKAIKVFNIHTGALLRAFSLYPDKYPQKDKEDAFLPPPPFLWSHDDSYLARCGLDLISIYETPTLRLLDRRSLSAEGIHEFQWSPSANIISYWAPEVRNAPAHVDLVSIPSRKFLRNKNLFNVTKCSMVWQEEGKYLGVKVTRHTKSKKTLYNNLELFRLNEPNVPVEMLDMKDAVMAFVWEPRGTRFALIHAENPSSTKVNVSFYDMMKVTEPTIKKKGKGKKETVIVAEVNKVECLEGKQCNCLFWSPAGGVIILASLGDSASGALEFYDVDDKTLVVKEHYRSNAIMWDPSGRTVASVVSQPIEGGHFKFAMDNGYTLWSFQGRQMYSQAFETFYQLEWRPREKLLSTEQIKDVQKNLKKYEQEFDKVDKERTRKLKLEETKEKRELRSRFRNMLSRLKEFRKAQKGARMELNDGFDSDDESNYNSKEIVLETIIDEKEKIYT